MVRVARRSPPTAKWAITRADDSTEKRIALLATPVASPRMNSLRRFLAGDTVRQTGVALVDQVLNSAVNFLVGIALIRSIPSSEYGLFVLANASLYLAIGFQHSIIVFPMNVLAPKRGDAERQRFINGLATTQFALWLPAAILLGAGAACAGALGIVEPSTATLACVTAAAAITTAGREFYRQLFFLLRRPHITLGIDVLFGIAFLTGVWLAALGSEQPAPVAVAAAGIAGLIAVGAGAVLHRSRFGGQTVCDFEPLRATLAPARWGVPGMLLAWLQNQGFFYLLGAALGTTAVATVSASRLLLVPIPMLITAIESVVRPRAADWIGRREYRRLTRQLAAMTGAATVVSLAFTAVVFVARHFIVETILQKTIDDLDLLLVCWGIVFLAQVVRTNISVLLQALERFDVLFFLTLLRGVVSFAFGYAGILAFGSAGILIGLAVGEVVFVATGAASARRRLREAPR